MIKVTVWNENHHERHDEDVMKIYPEGIHACIASFLSKNKDLFVRVATQEQADHGLTDDILNDTDVLIWWSHIKHHEVRDDIVDKIQERVQKGMGLIALHSSHFSKIFKRLMGTSCTLRWREGDRERIWVVDPSHPIAEGLPEYFDLEEEEMYGEVFDIPVPDELVFLGWFAGGEVIRAGCVFKRGYGKVFYFQPGHESYPIFYNPNIQKILTNSVYYLAPKVKREEISAPCTETPEKA